MWQSRLWAAAALLLVWVKAEVTLIEKLDGIYDSQPKLRIQGTDFPADPAEIKLTFLPPLENGADYTLAAQPTALILSLSAEKKWIEIESEGPPQPLMLTSAKVAGEEVLTEGGIQVATVLAAPDVEASDRLIYLSTPPTLLVNGTNFNAKHTALYFDPPLKDGVDFTMHILSTKQISLRKQYSHKWSTDGPGPLKLIAIDTGGGRLGLDVDQGGRIIAEVQADREGHGVTVEGHVEIKIYQSTPTVDITGVGFNAKGTALRFGNGLKGDGLNYTATAITPTQMTLTLEPGSLWRRNAESLPGPLILLAADAGDGYVALGPTAAKSGRKIATVYEDPSVVASTTQLYRTHSTTLKIEGTGFTSASPPVFYFESDGLTARQDYYTNVIDRTQVELKLATEGWMPAGASGPLKVVAVDTGAGKKSFTKPITVATVVDNEAAHESGVIVTPGRLHVLYQSEAVQKLLISGSGFKENPVLSFEPPLKADTDYTIASVTGEEITLKLVEGKKWRASGGPLTLMSIKVGADSVKLGGESGIQVATILTDPAVKEQDLRIYASHSKHFTITGEGFLSTLDPDFKPRVELDTVPQAAFTVHPDWTSTHIKLWLNDGKQWAHVKGEELAAIKVLRVDTGAGEVILPGGGVHVATVHADSDETICDDSCPYANDGQCDEATDSSGGVRGGPKQQGGAAGGWGYADDDAILGDDDSSMYAGFQSLYSSSSFSNDDEAGLDLAACEPGTDCTDCGVRIAHNGTCTNTCLKTARDGICDDARPGGTGVCLLGSDCQDCGPVGASNFTAVGGYIFDSSAYASSTDWFTDDSNFLLDDDWVLEGQEANAKPVYKRTFKDHVTTHREREGTGNLFMDVLWAIVILVGGTVSLGFCMLAYRRFKSGGSATGIYLPVEVTNPERGDDFEMARLNAADVTPDVVRIG